MLAIAIAAVLILAATKPDRFSVQRAIGVKAPPEKMFPLINDFHQWVTWSPWENKDPAMKRSYGGAESGKGAVYGWEGNKNVGSGRMEILDSLGAVENPDQARFLQTVRRPQHRRVHHAAAGRCHHVTWVMRGPAPFMSKLMQVFMNLDQMIGKDFETGLANLKKLAEK